MRFGGRPVSPRSTGKSYIAKQTYQTRLNENPDWVGSEGNIGKPRELEKRKKNNTYGTVVEYKLAGCDCTAPIAVA